MLQQYLTELQKINLLEREEELDLWRALMVIKARTGK